MAVPSLNLDTVAAFRPTYQDYLSKTRQHEHDNRTKWEATAKYFQNNQVHCTKNSQWGSESSFHQSLESFASEQMNDLHKERVQERKKLLKQLLDEEDKLYFTELNHYNIQMSDPRYRDYLETTRSNAASDYMQLDQSRASNGGWQSNRVETMRRRVEELQSAREEKRRQVAQAKLYQHWRENSADIRAIESEQLQKHVVDQWQDQVETKEQLRQREELAKRQLDMEMEMERQEAIAKMVEEEERKREATRNVANELVAQMEELKLREREAHQLKVEQDRLLQEQWKLQELESQRSALEKQRAGFELGRFLLQQYRTQLRRRFEQHKVERQQDIELLESLHKMQEREDIQRSEAQKAMLRDLQEALENAKAKQKADVDAEKQLDLIYRDEAERLWRKREAEWAAEQAARAKLLQAVLQERALQVNEKLDRLEVARRENIEERERAMQDMEMLRREAEAKEMEKEEQKIARKEDLEAAISVRREAAISARLEMQQELERQRIQEQQMKEMVDEERKVMTQRGYQPKTYAKLKNVEDQTHRDAVDTGRGDFYLDSPASTARSAPGSARRPQSHTQQRHFVNNIWDTGKGQ